MNDPIILIFDALSFVSFTLYSIIQLIFYFYVEPTFISEQGFKKKRSRKIPVLDDKPNSISEVFGHIIEYGIFNKYSFCGYKNCVRGNLKLLAVIFSSIPIGIFFYWSMRSFMLIGLIKNNLSPLDLKEGLTLLFAYWGFIISYFLLERGHNHKKWEYLANLYNTLISKDPYDDKEIYNYLKAALVLDLIEMEMWSHKSFYEIFRDVIEQYYPLYRDLWFPPNDNRDFFEINKDLYQYGITKAQALKIAGYAQQRMRSLSKVKPAKQLTK